MHLLKIIALITLAILGTSCTTTGRVRQLAGAETVVSEKALAFPPPGGPAIVSVIEQKHGGDVDQTISLSTSSSVPGQNFLKVQFLGVSGSNPGLGSTPYKMISEGAVSREMAATVPGVRLRVPQPSCRTATALSAMLRAGAGLAIHASMPGSKSARVALHPHSSATSAWSRFDSGSVTHTQPSASSWAPSTAIRSPADSKARA